MVKGTVDEEGESDEECDGEGRRRGVEVEWEGGDVDEEGDDQHASMHAGAGVLGTEE